MRPPRIPAGTQRAPSPAEAHPGERCDYLVVDLPAARAAAADEAGQDIGLKNLAQLRAVAEFFRRAEPHSPVSYFADKAANAGEQDLHAWLRTIVKDPASMAHIEEMLGVRPPE